MFTTDPPQRAIERVVAEPRDVRRAAPDSDPIAVVVVVVRGDDPVPGLRLPRDAAQTPLHVVGSGLDDLATGLPDDPTDRSEVGVIADVLGCGSSPGVIRKQAANHQIPGVPHVPVIVAGGILQQHQTAEFVIFVGGRDRQAAGVQGLGDELAMAVGVLEGVSPASPGNVRAARSPKAL